jgi:hypothetical protein
MSDSGPCDLEANFGALLQRLPMARGESILFTAEALPEPSADLSTPQIKISVGYKVIWGRDGVYEKRELLSIEATKRAYRLWGILILSIVFHEPPNRVRLRLDHPETGINLVQIGSERQNPGDPRGYVTKPHSFEYAPGGEMDRYPWRDPVAEEHLPCFWFAADPNDQQRSKIVGFGTDQASVRLAELFLNVGLPDNQVDEYKLDGDSFDITSGFSLRGVGRSSLDVILWLPGSIGYLDADPHP